MPGSPTHHPGRELEGQQRDSWGPVLQGDTLCRGGAHSVGNCGGANRPKHTGEGGAHGLADAAWTVGILVESKPAVGMPAAASASGVNAAKRCVERVSAGP